MVVGQSLEAGGEHLLGHLSATLDAMGAVHENLRLNDRDKTILLADGRVPC